MASALPHWNLQSIYMSTESEEYQNDKKRLKMKAQRLLETIESLNSSPTKSSKWLEELLGDLDSVLGLFETLSSYAYVLWSSNTADEAAQAEMDDLETLALPLKDASTRIRALLSSLGDGFEEQLKRDSLSPYLFWLKEQRFLAAKQMSPAEESLAADLQRSGGDAWDRLHGKISSEIAQAWDDGEKTVVELRALAYDPDRNVRRRAWEAECQAWKNSETALAAALNGVKGTSDTLNSRRGWGSTLEKSLSQNRLSRTALDAMLGAMTESLPVFRRYFSAKARRLGLERLSWYDLFAPLGEAGGGWTWDRVTQFVPKMFDSMDPAMGNFARRAFHDSWIDAEPRKGKVGGAYCIHFPTRRESRILCNFDGSFDAVSTVAHELGHAWHGEVISDLPILNQDYPMTLAETASIFAETLVFTEALKRVEDPDKPVLLDTYLMGASQVVVDILSRFRFESALMRRRPSGEVSPRELCEMMLDAQEQSYGSALHPEERHPWMWAVKGHYYSPDLAFYNFPYAFGQLFALGLFAQFKDEGVSFAPRYRELLRFTGSADAVTVGRSAGFDIEDPSFWRRGISMIEKMITDFEIP